MKDKPVPYEELIRQAKTADGRWVYAVFCTGCGVDLSKVCLGRIRYTADGPQVEVYHPLRCPDCGYLLLEMPKGARVLRPTVS